MKGVVDAGPVIAGEFADARYHIIDVGLAYLPGVKDQLPVREAGLGEATQVEDYFQQFVMVGLLAERLTDIEREDLKQRIQIVSDYSS